MDRVTFNENFDYYKSNLKAYGCDDELIEKMLIAYCAGTLDTLHSIGEEESDEVNEWDALCMLVLDKMKELNNRE